MAALLFVTVIFLFLLGLFLLGSFVLDVLSVWWRERHGS